MKRLHFLAGRRRRPLGAIPRRWVSGTNDPEVGSLVLLGSQLGPAPVEMRPPALAGESRLDRREPRGAGAVNWCVSWAGVGAQQIFGKWMSLFLTL